MNPNASTTISLPIVVTLALFVIMISIPFLIAIKELLRPKDDQPLFIDMFHLKEPSYFGDSFKKIISENIDREGFPEMASEVHLSKQEWIEICPSISIPPKTKVNHILYIKGDFETGEKSILSKEIYATGACKIGNENILRALYCESDIYTGSQCKISRWMFSEGNITISMGRQLGRSVACRGQLTIGSNSRFISLSGNPVSTVNGNSTPVDPGVDDFMYPETIPAKREVEWKIYKKHLSFNYSDDPKKEFKGAPSGVDNPWKVNGFGVRTQPSSIIDAHFISRKNLSIGENNTIYGCVKSYGNIIVGKNSLIYGNIFAEGNIEIGANCIILGNVFSQSEIFISKGAKISRPGCVKSVIGKKRIELSKDVVIFGYVLTEGEGVVS